MSNVYNFLILSIFIYQIWKTINCDHSILALPDFYLFHMLKIGRLQIETHLALVSKMYITRDCLLQGEAYNLLTFNEGHC